MKTTRLIAGLMVCLMTYACQQTQKDTGQTPSQTVATEQKVDEISRDTMTNREGVRLVMAFDNATHSARFVLKGEVIALNQDTMASGIKYSNSIYEFDEHQGEGVLKKGGTVVFSYTK